MPNDLQRTLYSRLIITSGGAGIAYLLHITLDASSNLMAVLVGMALATADNLLTSHGHGGSK